MTDQFLTDLSEIAQWIFSTNLEQSEDQANKSLMNLETDLEHLKSRLMEFPDSGVADPFVKGIRQFSIYEGRYSIQWVTQYNQNTVTLLSITDLKYPKNLRSFQIED